MLRTKCGKEIFSENIKLMQMELSIARKSGNDGFIYRIKTTPLQNAIMLASIIGSLLAIYDADMRNSKKTVQILRARLKKFMFSRSRSNKREFLLAAKYSDFVWQSWINFFAEKKPTIEVVTTIGFLYSQYDVQLNRYANINDKQIEAFANGVEDKLSLSLEQKSYEVADFLLDELAKFTGIKRKDLGSLVPRFNEEAA